DELWVLDTNPPHVNTPWDSLLPITPVPVHEPVTVSGKVKPPPPGPPPLAGVLSVPTGTRNPEQVSLLLTVALRVALPRSLLTTNAASGMTKQPEASVRGGCVGSGLGTKMNTERTVIFWAPPLPPGLTRKSVRSTLTNWLEPSTGLKKLAEADVSVVVKLPGPAPKPPA